MKEIEEIQALLEGWRERKSIHVLEYIEIMKHIRCLERQLQARQHTIELLKVALSKKP